MSRATVLKFETKQTRVRRKAQGSATASVDSIDVLKARVAELEEALRRAKSKKASPASLGVETARFLEGALGGIDWEKIARLYASAYFSIHSEEVDEFGYDPKFTETIRPLLEFLYAVWWRVETAGVERVPASGPTLVVANHSGVLPWDGMMINVALRHEHPARRHCRMLALDMFALLPMLAPFLVRTGAVRANPENGLRLLQRGEMVGVFPEGVKGVGKYYKDRYKLARFGRGGFVRIALRSGAALIPTAVVGSEEVHPMLARADFIGKPFGLPYFPLTPTFPWLGPLGAIPLPTKWSIEFGDAMDMSSYGPEAADDPILVNRLSQEVRQRIQTMIDGRLARRRSIWFG